MLTESEIKQIQHDLDNYKNLSNEKLKLLYEKIDKFVEETIDSLPKPEEIKK